jgi:hypothetical protein
MKIGLSVYDFSTESRINIAFEDYDGGTVKLIIEYREFLVDIKDLKRIVKAL